MLWYNAGAGTWYMGGKAALGQRKGILKAHDSAAAPELIKPGMWQLGQGEGKGWLSAPDVHCLHGAEAEKALKAEQSALLGAQRTVYLFDAQASRSPGTSGSTAPAWQGAYTVEATEEGRHRYLKPGDAAGSKVPLLALTLTATLTLTVTVTETITVTLSLTLTLTPGGMGALVQRAHGLVARQQAGQAARGAQDVALRVRRRAAAGQDPG